MGIEHDPGCSTSFHRLVHSLINETLVVELSGNDTTKIGKLVDVDTGYITLAVTCTTGTGGGGSPGRPPIRLAYVPLRHIVSVVES